MFRSLRFQLPALFFAGVIVFALVATAISFRLLQSYTIGRARADLRREAAGVTKLYAAQANRSNDPVPAPRAGGGDGRPHLLRRVDPESTSSRERRGRACVSCRRA